MTRKQLSAAMAVVALLAAAAVLACSPGAAAAADNFGRQGAGDLFYNFYVPGGGCGGVPAQLYLCPRPTPPLVGHTWFTYQPLMPHEFLYPHCRTYLRKNAEGGWTKTKVSWD